MQVKNLVEHGRKYKVSSTFNYLSGNRESFAFSFTTKKEMQGNVENEFISIELSIFNIGIIKS